MAIRTIEELTNAVRQRIGDDTSDEALALLDDVADTLGDLDTRAKGDGTDWHQMYTENDEAWRKRYRDRFESGTVTVSDTKDVQEDKPLTYENLFKEM